MYLPGWYNDSNLLDSFITQFKIVGQINKIRKDIS